MAQDIFLKIEGITGESMDETHKNEIEVLTLEWEILQESSMHAGSGGGGGKATVKDLTFEHRIDAASPILMKHALTGKHLKSAVLVMRKAGGKPLEYLTITMTDVIVTKVKLAVSSRDFDANREIVSLSFAKVEEKYTKQNGQGGSTGDVSAAYDIKANKEE
ncbi:Hcp family type VI secretion system effector [Bordetella sp. LUAb4]|uniref:Hcp family type VI secretion system effector n=1 Tax=Bordetella sp. LUAb4 TaxID=2843195 RepID=UPI001E645B58|nr:Hcp family type VI secretion system effector [Bordetella sp. LUAb4]